MDKLTPEPYLIKRYLQHALFTSWSDTPENRSEADPAPLADRFTPEDIDPESREVMAAEVLNFYRENWNILSDPGKPYALAEAFWDVRNDLQRSFVPYAHCWRREGVSSLLTVRAQMAGPRRLVVGDDGRVYQVAPESEG